MQGDRPCLRALCPSQRLKERNLSTQYDVKYAPGARRRRIGVILGSDVGRATKKDIANLPMAEKYYRSRAIGDFVSISDERRRVNGYSLSVAGHVVKKSSVKEGKIWHHTLYVKP
jgi:hypothetical protein